MASPTQFSAPFYESRDQRKDVFQTALPFRVSLAGTSTTIYTGKEGQYFLLRKVAVTNTTGASVNLTLTIGGDEVVSAQPIAANTIVDIPALAGQLIDTETDFAGLGSGLRVTGWGVRVLGGGDWRL